MKPNEKGKSMKVIIDGKEYEQVKESTGLSLQFIWNIRMNLHAEGDKLWAEGDKLRAEGDKLRAEGDKLWAEAILEIHGNIKLEWKNWNEEKKSYECHLENGEVYVP